MVRLPIAPHVVVKILLVVSLITSASVRWTFSTTRTALEVALQEFAFNGGDRDHMVRLPPDTIRMVHNDLQEHKFKSTMRTSTTAKSKTANTHDTPTPSITLSSSACQSPLLTRSLQRIPGYIEECSNSTFFGFVMRDLSNRFLYRSETDNHPRRTVVVVSENARQALKDIIFQSKRWTITREDAIRRRGFRVGESFLVDAMWYNHTAVALDDDSPSDVPNNIFLLVLDNSFVVSASSNAKGISLNNRVTHIIDSLTTRYAIFPVLSATQHFLGLDICQHFLNAGYKLQILSSSHVVNGTNPFPPNTLLKSVPQIEGFLRHGQNLTTNEETFQSYLFATRGWELAIPSRREYIDMTGLGNDHVIDVQKEGIPFRQCTNVEHATISIHEERLHVFCFGTSLELDVNERTPRYSYPIDSSSNGTVTTVELWLGHTNMSLLEAACVKCTQQSDQSWNQQTACVTQARLSSTPGNAFTMKNESSEQEHEPRQKNLIAIEIKGLTPSTLKSWRSIRHMMSLESLGFGLYSNFSGLGHDFVFSEGNYTTSLPSFWQRRGYEVFQSSTKWNGKYNVSTNEMSNVNFHGSQVQDMFDFDHDYPHCLGGKSKPQVLLTSAMQFIQRCRYDNESWAVFLSFPEGQEDETRTLIDLLDIPLTDFLSNLARKILSTEEWSNTIIALFSGGVRNRPILFLKNGLNDTAVRKNNPTSLDLSRALRGLVAESDSPIQRNEITFSSSHHRSDRSICESAFESNESTCYFESTDVEASKSAPTKPSPPSILSFYADIPESRKTRLHMDNVRGASSRSAIGKGCVCATNVRTWFDCQSKHPWDRKEDFREYFILVDCPERPMHLEVRMLRNDVLLERSRKKREALGYTNGTLVNIMFLEIDSVSQEYADRHFPKTRELLKEYRIRLNAKTGQHNCKKGLCSAEFSYVSLVGANSIPNQVAALSGCLSSSTQKMCGLNKSSIGEICNDPAQLHHGLRLERVRVVGEQAYWCPLRDTQNMRTPWIFSVLDHRGYINFFGEEFCYESSPYVTQGNVFSRFYQDIESHHVYCRLAERKIALQNLTVAANQRWGVNLAGPCIDGWSCSENTEKATISLQFLQKVWGTYRDTPKFAFLNAIAAHDYSFDWEQMTVLAERYDEHLSKFLRGVISRQDSQKTVIILRSDHGLQRGPMAMDHALQVEHRHPWTEILVPESLVPSKAALFENQFRMTTGFDLYTTMRSIIDRSNGISDEEGIPKSWSFDLLEEEIPPNRNCSEAAVDPNLCRTASIPRDYGVCNILDPLQINFCSS
ncbi:DUF229 domain containing protein [Nitzschia inconspicua]|uniref:DUF229 domain containing protein n=1 Tax=Nitzschia inconspicua TaxID=303405 RepID=A0A9K3LJH9_9STRA|nr:DUF229 domain containing protein [Nitzschia inconspicua]